MAHNSTIMGRPMLIESPQALMNYFKQYVQHEQDNPMRKVEYVGKDGRMELTPLETPITFEGFECYLREIGVLGSHLGHYESKKNEAYAAYLPIISHIRQLCFVHNFKGAAVGLFSPNLIAKKLGLIERTETTIVEQPLFNDVPADNGNK